jgi:heme O synthase-like polyprenyltransferase
MLLYVGGLIIASMLPFMTKMAEGQYLVIAVLLNILFFVPVLFAALTRKDVAMRMTFIVSIVYLPLLLIAMVMWRR